MANLCSSVKNLPVLIGIPAVTIFIMWLISGGMHIPSGEQFARVGYTQFFGHWDFHLLAKNVLFIDLIMLTAAGIAVTSVYKGVSTLWKGMSDIHRSQGQFLIALRYRSSSNCFCGPLSLKSSSTSDSRNALSMLTA